MKRATNAGRLLLALSWVLGLGLISAWSSPQNSPSPPAPASTIKQGYVIITPTSTATTGLAAFETFGEARGLDTEQAGVLPSPMMTSSALFVAASGRLSRNLGVAIANPDSRTAKITLTLNDDTGKTIANSEFDLAPHNQAARFVTQLFANNAAVPRDLVGTLFINSNIPVAVVGLRFRGLNFSAEPATNLAAAWAVPPVGGGVGGPASVILAHFAAGGGWASEIVMANTSTFDLTVRVDLFAPDGSPLITTLNNQTGSTFLNIHIPPGGVATLAPLDKDGDSPF